DLLECAVPPTTRAHVNGDPELLRQLFANLIENAIRHSPKGTSIGVSLAAQGDRHLAVIWDSGPGVPSAERENVFRRLYRLERGGTTPGSGLRFGLVAAIAELHGASVALQDNKPGLRVEVAFPKA